MKDTKGCIVGRGQVFVGQTEDSILQVRQLTELKQTKEWERYPNRFRRLYETLLPENLAKHCQKWPAGKTDPEIKFLIKKQQQTARSHIVYWWPSRQRPIRMGLHCHARCDHHPRRQCSLYGLNFQLGSGDGSSHPCPPLDCLSKEVTVRWHLPSSSQIQWACHKKWNGKPRVKYVNGRHPPSKTPVIVLPWTCRSERQDRLAGKPASSSGLHLGWPEVFRSSRPYPREQGLGHHTTDRLEERGVCYVLCYC